LIARDGRIARTVEEHFRAYHAGVIDINNRSIGIELEDRGTYLEDPKWAETLYEPAARLVACLTNRYNIPRNQQQIVGHSDVNARLDPGPYWDWARFMSLVENVAGSCR
jgi:N-acetyl-anhydromuramyl-L-alanine amidase AmpD